MTTIEILEACGFTVIVRPPAPELLEYGALTHYEVSFGTWEDTFWSDKFTPRYVIETYGQDRYNDGESGCHY